MQTIQHALNPSYLIQEKRQSIFSRFLLWCKNQENNRLAWLAVIIGFHGCVLTPATVMLIVLAGNSMILWSVALGAMAMCLITNLSALPTKITVPVFFISLTLDLIVIGICLGSILY